MSSRPVLLDHSDHVELHPVDPLDLPVLVALPGLVALPELDGSALPVAAGEQDDLDREAAGLVSLRRFA